MNASTSQIILVVGATGGTGRHVVHKLLQQGQHVRVIVRSKESMMHLLSTMGAPTDKLVVTEASVFDMSIEELQEHLKDTSVVVSCLGHNPSFSGIWGGPWKLVTESVRKIARAILVSAENEKVLKKFILMASDGVVNPSGTDEIRPFSERLVLSLIRSLIPPHSDNEGAVSVLYNDLGRDATVCPKYVEWTVVRPTVLIDGDTTEFSLHHGRMGSLFGSATARRSNVAHFMVDLIAQEALWNSWKFKMPVLHDTAEGPAEGKGDDSDKK